MALQVKYNPTPIWQGSSAGRKYSLHRAILSSTVGWSFDGYVLFKGSAVEGFYYEGYTSPYQGLWPIFIEHVEASATPMPAPDPNDVVEFFVRFASLCERGGEPLQGEFLL